MPRPAVKGTDLKVVLQAKLNIPRCSHLGRNLSEAAHRGDVTSGRAEADVVEGVEELHAEVKILALSYVELLSDRSVEVEEAGRALCPHSRRAESTEG